MQQFVPGYTNPYMTAQQRLHLMEQQYPQFVQSATQYLVAIPVSNTEEANAFRVDLNGTPTLFYNAGKNEVYLKRTNTQTGLADFIIFTKKEALVGVPEQNTTNDNIELLSNKIDSFAVKLDGLYSLLTQHNDPIEETTTVNTKGSKNAK